MGQPAAPVYTNRATFFADSLLLFTGEDAPKPKSVSEFLWIHCANEGVYKGHHQGEFDLTRETFAAFVRNFRADPRYRAGTLELDGKTYTGGVKQVLQFDYEHASEMPPWEGAIPKSGAPACGWVLDVAVRDDAEGKAQLWVFGKLGSQIRQQIAREEYLFVSMAFTLHGVHWITGAPMGPTLTSVGFTNHPFMADIEPLAAANRPTSVALGLSVKPSGNPSEAPGVVSVPPSTGDQSMTEVLLRERVCKALNIRTLADDVAVGEAVEEAASAAGNLKSLLEALGVQKPEEAMRTIPELRSAREKLAGLLSELDALLQQETAVDAEVAKTDIGAAMKAQGYQGDGASKALGAYRSQCVAEEVRKLQAGKKPGETVKLSEMRDARQKGREHFLSEYGVKNGDHAHLSTPIIATRGGNQLEAPTVPGRPLTIGQREENGATAIDLRGLSGANPTEKLITHLSKSEPGFDKLPWERKVKRAGELRRTSELVLE